MCTRGREGRQNSEQLKELRGRFGERASPGASYAALALSRYPDRPPALLSCSPRIVLCAPGTASASKCRVRVEDVANGCEKVTFDGAVWGMARTFAGLLIAAG